MATKDASTLRRVARVAWLAVRAAALAVLGLAVLYLVGMNVLLRTRLLRKIVTDGPDKLLLEYSAAYSILPGKVHVEGLSLRGRDDNEEWVVGIDRCSFWFSPLDLLHRRFHASGVDADGIDFRWRGRLKVLPPQRSLEALPTIPGFPSPSFAPPPAPPLTNAESDRLWSVDLETATATHVREVWVNTLRFAGDYDVRGRWLFRPDRWLEVGPASITVRNQTVGYGPNATLASDVHGSVEATVHPFDLRDLEHGSFMPHLSMRGDVAGVGYPAAFFLLLEEKGLALEAPGVPTNGRVLLDHGVLRPGSYVTSAPAHAILRAGDFVFDSTVVAQAHVDDAGGHAEAHAADLHVLSSPTEQAEASSLALAITTRELDVAKPFRDATFEADARDVQTASLASWAFRMGLPGDVRLEGGHVRGEAHASGNIIRALRGELAGRAEAHVEDLGVRASRLMVRSSADVELRLPSLAAAEHAADVSGSRVTLADTRVTFFGQCSGASKATPCKRTARVLLPRVVASASELAFSQGHRRGALDIDVPQAVFPDLASLGALFVSSPLISVQSGRGTARAHLTLDVGTGSGRADAEVRADSLQFKIGDQILNGTATASVSARGPLNALDLSNTTLSFRGDESGWWADARLPRATVSLGPAPGANLSFAANARDGSPVVSAAAKASSVPRWIMNLVPLNALSVAGDLVASPTLIELPSIRAESRGATVEFCYAKGPPPSDGKWALLVETGIFHVGVHGNGGAGLVPVNARPWFEGESAAIRAAAESSAAAHRLR